MLVAPTMSIGMKLQRLENEEEEHMFESWKWAFDISGSLAFILTR